MFKRIAATICASLATLGGAVLSIANGTRTALFEFGREYAHHIALTVATDRTLHYLEKEASKPEPSPVETGSIKKPEAAPPPYPPHQAPAIPDPDKTAPIHSPHPMQAHSHKRRLQPVEKPPENVLQKLGNAIDDLLGFGQKQKPPSS
jgi:outer membrane biosynthesis protein TonB